MLATMGTIVGLPVMASTATLAAYLAVNGTIVLIDLNRENVIRDYEWGSDFYEAYDTFTLLYLAFHGGRAAGSGILYLGKKLDDWANAVTKLREYLPRIKQMNPGEAAKLEEQLISAEKEIEELRKIENELSKVVLKSKYEFGEVIVTLEDGTEVGRGGLNNSFLQLEINAKQGDSGIRIAKGSKVFDEIFSVIEFNNNSGDIKGIEGLWYSGLTDNLDTFNRLILEKVSKGLMTEAQAAQQTFTGIMAGRKEFTKVLSIAGKKNIDGTYQNAKVKFVKP